MKKFPHFCATKKYFNMEKSKLLYDQTFTLSSYGLSRLSQYVQYSTNKFQIMYIEVNLNKLNNDTSYRFLFSSSGLVNVLLEYVLYYCKGRNGDQTELVTKACFMLQRAARGNKKVLRNKSHASVQ